MKRIEAVRSAERTIGRERETELHEIGTLLTRWELVERERWHAPWLLGRGWSETRVGAFFS